MFSFVLLDNKTGNFMAARDPIGITPLYMGWGRDGSVWFASEMKALTIECDQFQEFPPGHIYSSKQGACGSESGLEILDTWIGSCLYFVCVSTGLGCLFFVSLSTAIGAIFVLM